MSRSQNVRPFDAEAWCEFYRNSPGAVLSSKADGHSPPQFFSDEDGMRLQYRVVGDSPEQVLERLDALQPPGSEFIKQEEPRQPKSKQAPDHWCAARIVRLSGGA